jgi:multiple sugar transport system ATP-binding protein
MTREAASIAFRSVTKTYGDTAALDELSLEVPPGHFLVLLGPSGCGKTTLLRITSGLIVPDRGRIEIGGRSVEGQLPKDRDVAMVFQSYALYPHLSVAENLGFPLKALKRPPSEIRERVQKVARLLSIDEHLDRRPEQLSGGQAQRVALGRAIIREPAVFLMDEPLSNLDAKLRVQLRVELKRLHQQLGITTLYVTHDQEEALTLGDSIAVINAGHIDQVGTPEQIYNGPASLFVARFVGSPEINTIEAQLESGPGGESVLRAGSLALPVEGTDAATPQELIFGVRPEAVRIGGAEQFPAQGSVDVVEMVGRETRVYVSTDAGDIVAVTSANERRYRPGERVSVGFDFSRHHLFDRQSGAAVRSIRLIQEEVLHA